MLFLLPPPSGSQNLKTSIKAHHYCLSLCFHLPLALFPWTHFIVNLCQQHDSLRNSPFIYVCIINYSVNPGAVIHTCDPIIQEAEAGKLQITGQLRRHIAVSPCVKDYLKQKEKEINLNNLLFFLTNLLSRQHVGRDPSQFKATSAKLRKIWCQSQDWYAGIVWYLWNL